MADFSELCPLFTTGVFKELCLPYITMTDITVSGNALIGTAMASHACTPITFGRTVVVTGAFVRRYGADINRQCVTLALNHHTSQTAVGTTFGTLTITLSSDLGCEINSWTAMNVTAKTFTSSDILGISPDVGTALSGGIFDLILRYKEK